MDSNGQQIPCGGLLCLEYAMLAPQGTNLFCKRRYVFYIQDVGGSSGGGGAYAEQPGAATASGESADATPSVGAAEQEQAQEPESAA